MPVLDVAHLTTAFRSRGEWVKVVNDVSFSVEARETLAIVGESGSGKSVTALSIMRLLSGENARVSGSVRLAGSELLSLTEPEMEGIRGNRIAMIFQEPMTSLNPVLTIGRQIGETIMRHRGASQSVAASETVKLLDRVRIPGAAARMADYPHQLSGGTLQRIMIAMALACQPELLIADEPTTALDVTVQAQILHLIRELQDEEGMAVLFITHDMGVVAEIADRTAVMQHSRLVETGNTTTVFARPAQPYTRALLSAVPRLGSMTGLDRPTPFDIVDTDGEHVASQPFVVPDRQRERPVLSVRNLVTRFDIRGGIFGRVKARVHAVEDVSFDVHEGETLALVGESGCGKSTIGRSILRLVKPVSGSIHVEGTDVLALSGRELTRHRCRMQMIFQDPMSSLNPRMRVGEALIEPIIAHGLANARVAREAAAGLLVRVGLHPDMLERFPHQFSGGQKQRLCIARALALSPALIVADEAVSALDVSIKAQVINLMLELQAGLGLAYLFISHDMAVVERVSHRIAVMYMGEIVEIGPRASILGNPQHPYTKRLLSAVPIADPTLRHRPRTIDDSELKSPLHGTRFEPSKQFYREVGPGHLVQLQAMTDATRANH